MINMSVENLIKVNQMFNEAKGIQITKHEDVVIIEFIDEIGEVDATVLTYREYELVRIDFYTETLNEIINLALDKDQKMQVTITSSVQNFPVFIEFDYCEFFCDLQEYRYILEQVEIEKSSN